MFTKTTNFEFVGNIEPKEVLDPPCDVLISDGFTANIVMKTVEGAAKGLGKILKQEFTRGFFGKIGSLFVYRNLQRYKNRLNPEQVGGAMIYGLKGVVVKAQGSSKAKGYASGIRQAALIVRNDVINKVKTAIESEQQ